MRLVPILVVALATPLFVTACAPVAFAEPETTRPSESSEQQDVPGSAWGDSRSLWRWAIQGEWELVGTQSAVKARHIVNYIHKTEDLPTVKQMMVRAGLTAEEAAQMLEWDRLIGLGREFLDLDSEFLEADSA